MDHPSHATGHDQGWNAGICTDCRVGLHGERWICGRALVPRGAQATDQECQSRAGEKEEKKMGKDGKGKAPGKCRLGRQPTALNLPFREAVGWDIGRGCRTSVVRLVDVPSALLFSE